MFTQTHCQAASFDAMRTAFRHAAEAEARQQAATTQAVIGAPGSSRAGWPQRQGGAAAAFASVLVSITLLSSVVIGMTSMADSADMTLATTSAPSGDGVASKPASSPLSLTA